MQNDALADRLLLEQFYDRPSFHCGHVSCTIMGRMGAVMEQHQDAAHADMVAAGESFSWYDFRCELCGFDVRAELHRLYPESQGELYQ